eukprot:scaffold5610_cov137-Isochrysis_galbana.AAC.5
MGRERGSDRYRQWTEVSRRAAASVSRVSTKDFFLAQAVVVHAALTPSPAHSGLKKERGMGKEWGRGGGVSGRLKDRGCPVVTPLVRVALSSKDSPPPL